MQHKYRAWDPYTKKMDYDCRDSLSFWNGLVVPEGDHVPLRWTGLKDKNGKEIYEGDIVRLRGISMWRVDWSTTLCRWMIVHDANYPRGFPLNLRKVTVDKLEVIGNVYEFPELLA